MEFEDFYTFEIVRIKARQTDTEMNIPISQDSKQTKNFPIGSWIIQHANGQQQIVEDWVFQKHYKPFQTQEIKENAIVKASDSV